jgi:hypothetical protein
VTGLVVFDGIFLQRYDNDRKIEKQYLGRIKKPGWNL